MPIIIIKYKFSKNAIPVIQNNKAAVRFFFLYMMLFRVDQLLLFYSFDVRNRWHNCYDCNW